MRLYECNVCQAYRYNELFVHYLRVRKTYTDDGPSSELSNQWQTMIYWLQKSSRCYTYTSHPLARCYKLAYTFKCLDCDRGIMRVKYVFGLLRRTNDSTDLGIRYYGYINFEIKLSNSRIGTVNFTFIM